MIVSTNSPTPETCPGCGQPWMPRCDMHGQRCAYCGHNGIATYRFELSGALKHSWVPDDDAVRRAMEAEDAHRTSSREERVRAMLGAAMRS